MRDPKILAAYARSGRGDLVAAHNVPADPDLAEKTREPVLLLQLLDHVDAETLVGEQVAADSHDHDMRFVHIRSLSGWLIRGIVDSMIRDLMEASIQMVQEEEKRRARCAGIDSLA